MIVTTLHLERPKKTELTFPSSREGTGTPDVSSRPEIELRGFMEIEAILDQDKPTL